MSRVAASPEARRCLRVSCLVFNQEDARCLHFNANTHFTHLTTSRTGNMDEDAPTGPLFADVVYTVIPGGLENISIAEVMAALESAGARFIPLRESDQQIDEADFEKLTHILCSHVDFPQYYRVLDAGIPIVRPQWVPDCIRKRKQASTRQHSPDPSQFFRDVVVCCADISEYDSEAITGGVVAMGGQHTAKLTKIVTHLVTNSMDHSYVKSALDRGSKIRIVLPHWFDDCFRLGKKISERPYEFPDPELLRKEHKTNAKINASPHLDGAISSTPSEELLEGPPPSPSKDRKYLNALMSKNVFFCEDLQLSGHLVDTLSKLINHAGGMIVQSVEKAHIYIGQYRDGEDYKTASRAGKEVANLAWLYHVINRNRYTNPKSRLFHYPVPRNGIEGFHDMKISLSNYSGDSRAYVENLIRACGAEYTKTMKQDNTHLVTAHKQGEKCDAAQEWGLHLVSHLWLEESYAKCTMQSMSNPKYSHFPARTNLGEVTGQTSLDMKNVEKYYFPKPRSPQKQRVAQKSTARQTLPASSVLDTGVPAPQDVEQEAPATVDEADEMDIEEDEAPKTAKKPRGKPSRVSLATPRAAVDGGKENESPAVASTGRASKLKALTKVHSAAEDMNKYKKEEQRVGGVIYGGLRREVAAEESPAPQRTSRKRTSDEYDPTGVGSDLSDGETQDPRAKQAKKAKHVSAPPIEYRMMVTGDERWMNNQKKEAADKVQLRGLGVLLTTDPKDVDILVAPKILRTRKFVCALACAPLVVDTTFLDTALAKKKLLEDPPMLKDRENEERLGFKLADTLKRAQENNKKLFRGWTVFITEDVNGGFDTYKDIITLNGGQAMLYKGRNGFAVSKRSVSRNDPNAGTESRNQGGDDEVDYVYLISGKKEKEIKMWPNFRENAAKHDVEARIVSTDWLLNAAMSQRITFEDKWLLDEKL